MKVTKGYWNRYQLENIVAVIGRGDLRAIKLTKNTANLNPLLQYATSLARDFLTTAGNLLDEN